MTGKRSSLHTYDRQETAERYHRRGGFAAERKERLLEVALDVLLALTPEGSTLLELGAGTGHFTQMVIGSGRFKRIEVTDGAPAMLDIAQELLPNADGALRFSLLDFEEAWAGQFAASPFDAVASTMALHHAAEKLRLFKQIYTVLKPGGVFVLGDHMAAASALGQELIGRERALIKLGREQEWGEERIKEQMQIDQYRQKIEGDRCESVTDYLNYLLKAGFTEVDCLWQDFWLALFVAKK